MDPNPSFAPPASVSGPSGDDEERTLADELELRQERYNEERRRLNSFFHSETWRINTVCEDALGSIRMDFNKEKNRLESTFYGEEALRSRRYDEMREEALRRYKEELARIARESDEDLAPLRALLNEETAQLKAAAEEKMGPIKAKRQQDTSNLKLQFENETKGLHAEFQSVNGPLEQRLRDIRRQRNGSASVSRLPNEVLSMIFVWALAVDRPSSYRTSCLPFNVSVVSSRWRAVALSTPRLWSRLCLSIEVPYFERKRDMDDLEALTDLVLRSKAVPFDVSLGRGKGDVYHSSGYNILRRVKVILEVVAPHLGRCRSLKLDLRGEAIPWINQQRPIAMPHLEELSVALPDYSSEGGAAFPLPTTSPRLSTLCLRNVTGYASSPEVLRRLLSGLSSITLVSSTILSLTGEALHQEDLAVVLADGVSHQLELSVLEQADNLVTASLHDQILIHPPDAGAAQFNKLRSLHLKISSSSEMTGSHVFLSSRIMLPSLCQLTVFSATYLHPAVDNLFKSPTHLPSLEKLTLYSVLFDADSLLQFLASGPGLRVLHLSRVPVSVAVLDGLNAKMSRTLCPKLGELKITSVLKASDTRELAGVGYRCFTFASLKRMLASRKPALGAERLKILVWKGYSRQSAAITDNEAQTLSRYVQTLVVEAESTGGYEADAIE